LGPRGLKLPPDYTGGRGITNEKGKRHEGDYFEIFLEGKK